MTQTPTLAQLLKQAIDNRLLEVHTALIGVVESYDVATQQVNVSPALKRRMKTLEGEWISEQLPVLCEVPVLFPRAGKFFISFPIQPGDFVQLIFNEVSIDEWVTGEEPAVRYNQRFVLPGAVAIPGIYPQSKALTDAHEANMVLGQDNGLQIHIDSEKIRLGSADVSEALAIASKVEAELERIKSAFNSHTHIGSCPSGAVSTNPTTSRLSHINSVAAQHVVAE